MNIEESIELSLDSLRDLKRLQYVKLNEALSNENWNAVISVAITIKQIEYTIFNLKQP